MKHILLTAVMAVGLAGTASAQNLSGVLGGLNTTVANLNATTLTLVNGDAGATAVNLSNTVNSLTVGLSSGTPLAGLATTGADLSNQLVTMSLTRTLTDTLTQQSQPVVTLLAPLSAQGVNLVGVLSSVPGFSGGVPGVAPTPGSPNSLNLTALTTLVDGILGNQAFPIPGLDALPLSALPLDALDPSTLTALLGGASLPGLGDAGALPGADSLTGLLDPAALTGLLGGGLPGADSLPLPGLDALPLNLLDLSILTGLLSGGLPALPALPAT